MHRRIFAAIVCLLLFVSLPGFAQLASQGYDVEGLRRYSSFTMDEESGEWSVSDPLFEAVLDAVQAGEAKNYMKEGLAVFQMRLSGNAQTGTLRPEIELLHISDNPIGVRAVSILAGKARYDLRAAGQVTSIGAYQAERVVLPMQNLNAARAIASAKNVSLLLHGADGVYETVIASNDDKNAKTGLEGASLRCDSLLGELETMHIDSYRLWDLSAAEWEAELGFEPACIATRTNTMGMLVFGDRGDAVEALQDLLAGAGFYAGAREREYGAKTSAAVARAQVYFGLLETGSADDALINCLQSGLVPAAAEAEPPEEEVLTLADVQVSLHRWWQAGRVLASRAKDLASGLICSDSGNIFVVCEGEIRNGSSELGLGWQMSGELIVNGNISYSCVLRAESDDGEGFASALLPMAESRLLVLAEVPGAALAGAETAELVLHNGTETIEYKLIGE